MNEKFFDKKLFIRCLCVIIKDRIIRNCLQIMFKIVYFLYWKYSLTVISEQFLNSMRSESIMYYTV